MEIKNKVKELLDIALTGKEPIKGLLDRAKKYVKSNDIEHLRAIDLFLHERFIEYLRKGTKDDLEKFIEGVLRFIDSNEGIELNKKNERLVQRWEHLYEVCDIVVETLDPQLSARLIESRKHGRKIIETLSERGEVRFKELADIIGISEQNLSKVLREFERESIIERSHSGKSTFVTLGFIGRLLSKEYAEKSDMSVAAAVDKGRIEPEELKGIEERHPNVGRLGLAGKKPRSLLMNCVE